MPTSPHDLADLFLAPVALQVDQRLEEFGTLERDALHERVGLETNSTARLRSHRAKDVVASVTRLLELHGWSVCWDDRGVRLSHERHTLVLGVPGNVLSYVNELPDDASGGPGG